MEMEMEWLQGAGRVGIGGSALSGMRRGSLPRRPLRRAPLSKLQSPSKFLNSSVESWHIQLCASSD